jgi:hypothetical protein
MYVSKNKFSFITKATSLLSLAVILLASCSKDKNNAVPVAPKANLAIVHASPGSPELDFQINGTKVNQKSLVYGTFLTYGTLQSGKLDFSITKKDAKDVLAKAAVELKSDKAYSVYISDIPEKAALLLTEDDLSAPAADKAKIRFVNLSPDAGDLDLNLVGKATSLFAKTTFKTSTAFISIDPGTEVDFEIAENTKTVAVATLSKVKIEKGKIYTIWAKGLKAGTEGTKLDVSLIVNK